MAVSANSIKAGEGHVVMGINLTPLEKGLKDGGKALAAFGAGVAAVGASITAPMLYGLSVLGDMGTEIFETSRKTNMSFSEVQNAANGTKVSMDELGTATKKMDAFVSQAAEGVPAATEALAMMGLAVGNLANLSEHDRLLLFADGLQRVGDAAQRSHLQVQVFGRGGLAMNLTGGAVGVRERAERRAEIGGVLSDDDVRLAKAFSTSTSEMAAAVKGAWAQLGAAAAPIMIWFNNLITSIVITVRKWVEANRPLLTTIFSIGDKLVLIGGLIASVGGAIIGLSVAFGAMASAVGAVMGVILSPWLVWGLVIAGVAYKLWELYQTSPQIGAAFERWGPAFKVMGETFTQAWGGIADAISSNNLERAFRIAILGLKMEWLQFKTYFLDIWDSIILAIEAKFAPLLRTFRTLASFAPEGTGARVGNAFLTSGGSEVGRAAGNIQTATNQSALGRLAAALLTSGGSELGRATGGQITGPSTPEASTAPAMSSAEATARAAEMQARADELLDLQIQLDYETNEAASEAYAAMLRRAEDVMAVGDPGNLQMQLKGVSSGTFMADAIAGFLSGGESPQERGNRLLEEANRQNAEMLQLMQEVRDNIGDEYI